MMNTMSHYRPSKRPSVKDVYQWYNIFEDFIDTDWRGQNKHVIVEQAYPYPDFYRVTYTIDGIKKSKLFYGESAWMDGERFVSDLGFRNVHGVF
jgi:hypothetical protein